MATRDTRKRLAPPAPILPSSGDAMPRTVPSLASLGAVSAGIPKEATARPPKGRERHSMTMYCLFHINIPAANTALRYRTENTRKALTLARLMLAMLEPVVVQVFGLFLAMLH